MATENPTGDGRAVALTIPAGNKPFLRRVFTAARDGLREELEEFADQLREPRSKLLQEEAHYGDLLRALEVGRASADRHLCETLVILANAIDRENEYGRVVFEHAALHGLLAQLEEAVV